MGGARLVLQVLSTLFSVAFCWNTNKIAGGDLPPRRQICYWVKQAFKRAAISGPLGCVCLQLSRRMRGSGALTFWRSAEPLCTYRRTRPVAVYYFSSLTCISELQPRCFLSSGWFTIWYEFLADYPRNIIINKVVRSVTSAVYLKAMRC